MSSVVVSSNPRVAKSLVAASTSSCRVRLFLRSRLPIGVTEDMRESYTTRLRRHVSPCIESVADIFLGSAEIFRHLRPRPHDRPGSHGSGVPTAPARCWDRTGD